MLLDHGGARPPVGPHPPAASSVPAGRPAGRRQPPECRRWFGSACTRRSPALLGRHPRRLVLLRSQLLRQHGVARTTRTRDVLALALPVQWPGITFCDPVPPRKNATLGLALFLTSCSGSLVSPPYPRDPPPVASEPVPSPKALPLPTPSAICRSPPSTTKTVAVSASNKAT